MSLMCPNLDQLFKKMLYNNNNLQVHGQKKTICPLKHCHTYNLLILYKNGSVP